MDQDVQPKAPPPELPADEPAAVIEEPTEATEADTADHARDERVTRVVHIVLGLLIAAVAAWLLYRSHTELAFRGSNGEPGPGYLPVLLTICLIGLGLLMTGIWAFGAKARNGEAPTLSLDPRQMGRALLVWL